MAVEQPPTSRLPPSPRGFGKYERRREIGRGGFGSVWEGWDRELSRPVAMKFLHGATPEDLARFQREARTAARLSHPNIASIYDVGETDGEPYIVMELVAGRPARRAEPARAVEIVRQAALAVHHAHERGVIHRDLKPANLLVADADPPSVKVVDFGLAKSLSGEKSISLTGEIMGTPAYMSPEQARGGRDVDARSDVWGLGATLYALVGGRAPFETQPPDVYETLRRVIEEDPPSPPCPGLDRDVQTVILKCIEKDPSRRYASAAEVADELGRLLAGEPILAHPPSFFYRVRKRLAKRKAVVAAAIAAVLAGAVAVEQWIEGQQRQRVAAEVERAREQVRTAEMMTYKPDFDTAAWSDLLRAARDTCRPHDDHAPAHLVLGLVAAQRGEFEAAERAFSRAIELDSNYRQAYLERGMALAQQVFQIEHDTMAEGHTLMLGDRERKLIDRARADLEAAGDLPPGDRALAELLDLMLQARTDKELEAVERRAADDVAARRGDERLWRAAAEAAHRRFDAEEACAHMKRYLDARRSDALGWSRYAHLLSDAERPADARTAADRALALRPDLTAAMLSRGLVVAVLGLRDEAMADFDAAERLEPANPQVPGMRGLALAALEEYDAAADGYTRAIALDPADGRPYLWRAIVRFDQGRFAEAVDDCARALDRQDLLPLALIVRGEAKRRMGDLDGAGADHQRVLDIIPGRTEGLLYRARIRARLGDPDGALVDFDAAVDLEPGNAAALLERAQAMHDWGRPAEALRDYNRIIATGAAVPTAFLNRGALLEELGRPTEALADYTKYIGLRPLEAIGYKNRGGLRGKLGDYEAALADFQRIVELEPDNPAGPEGLATTLMNLGRMNEALEAYDRAVALNPNDPFTRLSRAAARAEVGRLAEARDDAKRGIELAPPGWEHLGDARDLLRRLEELLKEEEF